MRSGKSILQRICSIIPRQLRFLPLPADRRGSNYPNTEKLVPQYHAFLEPYSSIFRYLDRQRTITVWTVLLFLSTTSFGQIRKSLVVPPMFCQVPVRVPRMFKILGPRHGQDRPQRARMPLRRKARKAIARRRNGSERDIPAIQLHVQFICPACKAISHASRCIWFSTTICTRISDMSTVIKPS